MATQKFLNFHKRRIFTKLANSEFLGGWLQIYGQKYKTQNFRFNMAAEISKNWTNWKMSMKLAIRRFFQSLKTNSTSK